MAYILMAHDQETILGTWELIKELYDVYDYFLIHIDAKVRRQDFEHFVEYTVSHGCGNIHFVREEDRFDVQWGTFVSVLYYANFC